MSERKNEQIDDEGYKELLLLIRKSGLAQIGLISSLGGKTNTKLVLSACWISSDDDERY